MPATYEEAEVLRKSKQFEKAAINFKILWESDQNPMLGWRLAYCLRKARKLIEAEKVIRLVIEKYPEDKWSVNELVWVLYDKEIKPGVEKNNLGRVLKAADELMRYSPKDLALHRLVLQVMKAAKSKNRWDIVLAWSEKLDPTELSVSPPEFGTGRAMADREVWYISRSRALYELGRYKEAREQAFDGIVDYPDEIFLKRTAALSIARLGEPGIAVKEMEAILSHPRADWYIKAELAELEHQMGNADRAYQLICDAVSHPQDPEYKLGFFLTLAQIAFDLGKIDVTYQHLKLIRLVREQKGWKIPEKVAVLENQVKKQYEVLGKNEDPLPSSLSKLEALCRTHWIAGKVRNLDRATGIIKFFAEDKKFTFIQRDDHKEDVFVLAKDLPRECRREGARVDFAITESFDRKKGKSSIRAVDVSPNRAGD